jgi:hypothetical protein
VTGLVVVVIVDVIVVVFVFVELGFGEEITGGMNDVGCKVFVGIPN